MSEGLNFAGGRRFALSRSSPWTILAPAILGSLLGVLLSFSFPSKYTSQSLILVDPPDSTQNIAPAARSRDFDQPITNLQDLLNEEKLKPRVERLALGKDLEQEMADIRRNTRLTRAALKTNDGRDATEYSGDAQTAKAFHVEYTAYSPAEAQLICNAVTSILLQDDLNIPQQETSASAQGSAATDAAKRDLDEQNATLAHFKKQHIGQLPADVGRNMSASADLHTQLNMLSAKIQLAQQNKADAESLLRQRLSSIAQKVDKQKSPQKTRNTAVLEKQLSDLQSQLLQLQAQYADDHPDVVETKTEIGSIEKQLADLKRSDDASHGDAEVKATEQETPEIRQLRSRIQQDDQVIDEGTLEQKRIQNQISIVQARLVAESNVGSEYEKLLRARDAAQKKYAIATTNAAAEQQPSTLKSSQQRPRIRMLYPATIPRAPSFPNRLLFAITGWLGLAVIMRFVLWLAQSDDSPRPLKVVSQGAKVLSNNR